LSKVLSSWACKLHPNGWESTRGELMDTGDRPSVTHQPTDHAYTDLEAQLVKAVSDFGLEELHQMLDVAEVIRRTRRL
jgi:hypothetical protein